jgi:tRNA threonylcarbamoyladenosine biosynthesis protein TsaE
MASAAFTVPDAEAMQALGAALARALPSSKTAVFHLSGDLGAGKTTLVRGFLAALGNTGRVKSPTYTLVETYELDHRTAHHLDLYRLKTPEEAEGLGLRDLDGIVLVEWPEKGAGHLPAPDLILRLSHVAQVAEGSGRSAALEPMTPLGRQLVEKLGH